MDLLAEEQDMRSLGQAGIHTDRDMPEILDLAINFATCEPGDDVGMAVDCDLAVPLLDFRILAEIELDDVEELLAILCPLRGNHAACESAGPAIFVVQPGEGPGRLRLVRTAFNQIQPFLAHVRSDEPGPGMEEESAHPLLFHAANLPYEFIGVKVIVQ